MGAFIEKPFTLWFMFIIGNVFESFLQLQFISQLLLPLYFQLTLPAFLPLCITLSVLLPVFYALFEI